jgi:hypothetical protein
VAREKNPGLAMMDLDQELNHRGTEDTEEKQEEKRKG